MKRQALMSAAMLSMAAPTALVGASASILTLIHSQAHARASVKKIKVPGELRAELNSVLREAVQLQEASFNRNSKAVQTQIKGLTRAAQLAARKSGLMANQQVHMNKLLEALQGHLARAIRAQGADRQTHMQRAFKQVVTLAQTYQLDSYRIFFCPKDKSVWLQRGKKAQNPVNPETFGNCGKLVGQP